MRTDWNIYRTRFLVRARQLSEPVFFIDALGREHKGQPGDYLVESSDGMRRITPRQLFEDIYVAMHPAHEFAGTVHLTPRISNSSPANPQHPASLDAPPSFSRPAQSVVAINDPRPNRTFTH
jgi:hypothetical protein